jgi:hypothetical protein
MSISKKNFGIKLGCYKTFFGLSVFKEIPGNAYDFKVDIQSIILDKLNGLIVLLGSFLDSISSKIKSSNIEEINELKINITKLNKIKAHYTHKNIEASFESVSEVLDKIFELDLITQISDYFDSYFDQINTDLEAWIDDTIGIQFDVDKDSKENLLYEKEYICDTYISELLEIIEGDEDLPREILKRRHNSLSKFEKNVMGWNLTTMNISEFESDNKEKKLERLKRAEGNEEDYRTDLEEDYLNYLDSIYGGIGNGVISNLLTLLKVKI